MRTLETYHTFGRFANEPALRLADRLVALGPIPDAKVMLTSGGGDSVDLACKLARRHWQLEGQERKRVILSRDKAPTTGCTASGPASPGCNTTATATAANR